VARNPKNVVAQNLQAVRTIGGKPPEQCTPEEIIDTFDFMLSLKARYHGGTIPLFGVPWSKVLDGVLSCASDVLKRKTSEHADPTQETISAS
jgi:hypothetical protein